MADWCDLTLGNPLDEQPDFDGERTESARPQTPPSASQSAKTSKPPRVQWDLRKTRVFLEALVTALNNGAMYRTSNKAVARSEMLRSVLPRMREDFPTTVWTLDSLTSKFKSLESDMRKVLTLITRSGNHYNDETGMIETTDEQWAEFGRKYGDKVKTIRIKGFPWVESLMKQIWPDARPTSEGIQGARTSKRRYEEEAGDTETPDTAPPETPRADSTPSTPGARVPITPGTRQSIPKRRHRRLDQLVPQPTSLTNSLRLFSVTQNVNSMRQAVEICATNFGEELGAEGRLAVGTYFVEHPEFLGVFLGLQNDDRRNFLVSNGLMMEEANEDRSGDEGDLDGLV
ncbi:hypothetical protein E4U27_008260 [Claviceps purpurea]|nr:hypothetical protein E4U27_008260 [Claviceps purpurea]KAG6215542.1 hypothetical protein E4U26_008472 [Claviceps purpurea]